MRLKSYYAPTVERAIAQARQELGEDIMLIHSRRAAAEFAHLGAYEVVFAISPIAVQAKPPISDELPALALSTPSQLPPARSGADYGKLRSELTQLAISLEDSYGNLPTEKIAQLLTEQGIHPNLTFDLLKDVKARCIYEKPSDENVLTILREQMAGRIETTSGMTVTPDRPTVAAFIGPPGCGKSSTLVKIAANYGLNTRRPCLIVSTDNLRIGASEQLRSYAAILGTSFEIAATPVALAQILEENKSKDLILIDTPGLSKDELDDYEDWARFFSSRITIEKHLILSASMKNADVTSVVDRYRMFGPNRLLFTKLDETSTKGIIWSEAVRTGLPLSFLTHGQRIPEDIEEATAARLLDAILMQESRPRSASAGM